MRATSAIGVAVAELVASPVPETPSLDLPARAPGEGLTVVELCAAYWSFAEGYYVKDGKPTSTLHDIRQAVKPLKRLYGRTLARDFGLLALKAIREEMVRSGWVRGTVNKRVDVIRRIFRWGGSEELVPPSVVQALQAVAGLRKGRCDVTVR